MKDDLIQNENIIPKIRGFGVLGFWGFGRFKLHRIAFILVRMFGMVHGGSSLLL